MSSSTHPNHEISALIRVGNRAKAKEHILNALRASKMHKGDAVKRLRCAHTTYLFWVEQLGLAKVIEVLEAKAKKEGWHHGRKGGRPLGTTVANGAAPRGSRVVNPG